MLFADTRAAGPPSPHRGEGWDEGSSGLSPESRAPSPQPSPQWGEAAGIAGRLCLSSLLAVTFVACFWASTAQAQTPFVPDEWKFGKRQESNTLHYCVDGRDPDLP